MRLPSPPHLFGLLTRIPKSSRFEFEAAPILTFVDTETDEVEVVEVKTGVLSGTNAPRIIIERGAKSRANRCSQPDELHPPSPSWHYGGAGDGRIEGRGCYFVSD